MASDILIRNANISDVRAITEITAEAFNKYALDLGTNSPVRALSESENDILEDMRSKEVLIGELAGVPSGSIRFEIIGNIGYISRFGVKLVAQSRGLGGALINAVKNSAYNHNLDAVALHTSSKMASLIRFYYGKGFYIHSTSHDRDYVRALLICELKPNKNNYESILMSK